jgi:energy-coupling factor transport system ATP-binding protein
MERRLEVAGAAIMLQAHGVRLAYPGGPPCTAALDLTISPGEWVALTGANGTGKSLLALALAGLVRPVEGEVCLDGVPIGPASNGEVGILFQDPESQLVTGEVDREIAFPLENLGWPREEIDRRVEEIKSELAITHLTGRALAALSGGEKSRVALAAALASRPRLLILDEPGVYLDPDNRELLREVLRHRAAEGLGILLVTQLEEEWRAASRRLRLLDSGLVEAMGAEPLGLAATEAPGEDSTPLLDGSGPRLVLAARDLSFRYPDRSLLPAQAVGGGSGFQLLDIELELHAGETVFLQGESGSGKTTLLLLLAGVLDPGRGQVRVYPPAPNGKTGTTFGVLLQSPEDQLVSATVLDDILLGLRESRQGSRDAERRARKAMAEAGLDPERYASLPPGSLSHGQRRRVAWCGIWVLGTGIWLLDEPTAGLDEEGLTVLGLAIAQFTQTGGAVLMATQDPRLDRWPGRRVRLEAGVQQTQNNPLGEIPSDP